MKYVLLLILIIAIAGCQEDVLKINDHVAVGDEEIIIQDADERMNAEWITYGDFRGYLVKPVEANSPGVVMIHEWWGLNQNIKNMAHDLAEEGFTVIAVDLFDGQLADNSNDARKYSTEVRNNMDRAILHLQTAVQYLRDNNHDKVASMGWCFGGGMSMQLSLNEMMDATVIYYGAVETDNEVLQTINWPILGIFGEVDSVIPLDDVNDFDSSLDELGIENEIYVYDGLGHAFANPSNAGHDPASTEDAWMKTVTFLNKHLK